MTTFAKHLGEAHGLGERILARLVEAERTANAEGLKGAHETFIEIGDHQHEVMRLVGKLDLEFAEGSLDETAPPERELAARIEEARIRAEWTGSALNRAYLVAEQVSASPAAALLVQAHLLLIEATRFIGDAAKAE